MAKPETPEPIVRHFRQIVMWPLQLIPLSPKSQVQHHWQAFSACDAARAWHEVEDEFTGDSSQFHERHYREFVTFLPHAQRFLYGQGRSSRSGRGYGESPMRVFRRSDVTHVRMTFEDGLQLLCRVQHIDLYFYYDVDVVMLAFEFFADDVPLSRVQDLLYRFGRSYPAQWNDEGIPDQCMRDVEWLNAAGETLVASDFLDREHFLSHACEHREARIGQHWEFVLRPMVQHHSEHKGDVRYRDRRGEPAAVRKIGMFVAVLVPSVALTLFTVLKSGPLAEFIDAMANERLSAREKLERFKRVFRSSGEPQPRGQALRLLARAGRVPHTVKVSASTRAGS